ncbi:MAG: DeoR/GlpR family DNA-binding transcription regulator [Chthoniobacterales bacterium]
MKVALHQVHARREGLRALLKSDRYLSITRICRLLGVSEATARRDLAVLHEEGKITRTYGGAVGEYAEHFPAFSDRERVAPAAKQRIAEAAIHQMKSGETYFLDAGTTLLAIAKTLAQTALTDLTIVTNNLPVAEILSRMAGVQTHLLGGQFFSRQAVLLGDKTQKMARLWQFDAAFLGAEGMSAEGLWNSQADVVTFQRTILSRTEDVFFCLDATKINRKAHCPLAKWTEVPHIITDAHGDQLTNAQITLTSRQLVVA